MMPKDIVEKLMEKIEESENAIKELKESAHRLTGRVDALEREIRILRNENLDLKKADTKMRNQIRVASRVVGETEHLIKGIINRKEK